LIPPLPLFGGQRFFRPKACRTASQPKRAVFLGFPLSLTPETPVWFPYSPWSARPAGSSLCTPGRLPLRCKHPPCRCIVDRPEDGIVAPRLAFVQKALPFFRPGFRNFSLRGRAFSPPPGGDPPPFQVNVVGRPLAGEVFFSFNIIKISPLVSPL